MRKSKFAHEAKAKIDALLVKKRTKSKQNLVSEDDETEEESTNDQSMSQKAINADIHREEDLSIENKSYILDKFLNDSSHEQADPPVPKPRRSKIKSPGAETYIVSPIKTRDEDRKNSKDNIEMDLIETASNRTFDVNAPSGENSIAYESEQVFYVNETKSKYERKNNESETAFTSKIKKENSVSEDEIYNYNNIINVIIHRTDRLLLDSFVVHPVVKVHLVDSGSGDYLKKSDKSRNIIFYYENKEIDYISPVMTQAYNLQENRSLHPNWEESIQINEDFKYLTDHHNVLMFFEVMDFLSTNAIKQANPKGQLGWRKIAWAFLKLSSPTYSNVNKFVRLQLYYPSTLRKNISRGKCEIFPWWLKKKFRKYPSTLYVSINSIVSPTAAVETLRSRAPNEIETGKEDFSLDVPKSVNVDKVLSENGNDDIFKERPKEVVWERKENQICKLPNKCVDKINVYEDGCFVICFSHSGLYLACSIGCEDVFVIVIYSILGREEVTKMEAHQGLVHGIVWSSDDKILLTASADCTVCLWDMESYKFIQMLPHPSFVYTCAFHNNLIVTGCYDKFIRVWAIDGDAEYELKDELGDHSGYITSVTFNRNGTLLYSADSAGAINVWKYGDEHWNLRKQIKVLDLKDIIINQILLHRKERKLLVNSRDSKIRLVDIKTGYVLQIYHGAYNTRVNTRCSFTPCGNYIISGSENGEIYIWDTETGKIEQTYSPYDLQLVIHSVQYHPKDNYFAMCHYGNNVPVLIYKYDRDSDDRTSAKQSVHPNPGAFKMDVVRKEALSFKEILQKMDHLISPK